MNKEATDPSIAGEENISAENVSMDDYILQRAKRYEEAEEAVEEPQAEAEEETESIAEEMLEAEEESEEPESEQDEETEVDAEDDSEETNAESEIDIEAVMGLEPEQIQELGKKGKTRLLSRVGELTGKNKALEARIQELEAQGPAPATASSDVPEPIAALDTPEKVEKAMESYEQTLEITRKVLREKSDYDAEDVVYTDGNGRHYTKAELEAAEQGAINALSKHLPRQSKHLEDVAKYKQTNQMWIEQAKKDVPEIQDEESEIGKTYAQIMSSPNIAELKRVAPRLTVDLEWIFAHAVNSIKSAKKPRVSAKAGSKLKVKPPASPVGSGAARSGKATKGKAMDRYEKFAQTGSVDDLVAARIARAQGH